METNLDLPEILTSDKEDVLNIELENFKRGKNVVESCVNEDQLESALKFMKLVGAQHPGAAAALKYIWLLRKEHISKLVSEENEVYEEK